VTLSARPTSADLDATMPSSFVVDIGAFSGPLDLLLALIRDEEVDIYDIPIARIADQFLRRIHSLALNDAADYLEMAARLLRIKAQMLLPRHDDAESWEDPRADLVRRLLEYQQIREVVDVLERLAEDRRNRLSRGYFAEAAATSAPVPALLSISLAEVFSALDRVERLARKPSLHDIVPRAIDIDGAIARVRTAIADHPHVHWSDLVDEQAEPWQILSMLLALLELARRGELMLTQPRLFADVEISGEPAGQAA
jgi:segregation and condensation protein A